MIGRNFHYTGHPRHITHRFGDGLGTPVTGPILKICYLSRNEIAIFSKDKSISIFSLRGFLKHIYICGVKEKFSQMSVKQLSRKNSRKSVKSVKFGKSGKSGVDSDQSDEEVGFQDTIGFDEEPSETDLDINPTDIAPVPHR
jgi:hypothetical protein